MPGKLGINRRLATGSLKVVDTRAVFVRQELPGPEPLLPEQGFV